MHVEIKVAQNFVLNFLYNKLPRRRVNLFGEELDLALVDKFQDHWYPDKPFKGSAFRCLRVTDPNDPVLNRAARESGNPVTDIIENLPADLAIWIDPGEVSYRIGEKGSVKILYSESDSSSGFCGSNVLSSPVQAQGQQQIPQQQPAQPQQPPPPVPLQQSTSNSSSGASDDLNAEIAGFLPNSGSGGMPMPPPPPPPQPQSHLLDNLNSAMNGLRVNTSPSQTSSGPTSNGFSPFQPRMHHQPITYTAGTFAQTKFGSTKLKTNGKKTNRMSPTEFSNYIKQRALQKQSSSNNGPFPNMRIGNNGSQQQQQIFRGNNYFQSQSQQLSPQSMSNLSNMNLGNCGGNMFNSQQGHPSQQRTSNGQADPFFFPLFPDRGGCNNSSGFSGGLNHSTNGMMNPGFQGQNNLGLGFNNSRSTGNPWSSSVDSDTEAFLNDILTVGLNTSTSKQGRGSGPTGSNTSNFGSDLGLGLGLGNLNGSDFGLAGGLLADRFDKGSSSQNLLDLDSSPCPGGLAGHGKGVIGDSGRSQVNAGQAQSEKYHHRALVAN